MASKNKLCLSISLLLTSCCALSQVYANPEVSQAQAETIAQRFVQSMKGPFAGVVAVPGTSQMTSASRTQHYNADKAPDDPSNQDILSVIDNHPREYWRIERPGTYCLEVDEVTGHVFNYVNYTTANTDGDPSSGEAVPQVQARQLAEAALRATGASLTDFVFNGIEELQGRVPPTASGHKWYVSWLRTFHGIPYRREGARVFLTAETGKVIGVRVDEQSVDPPTVGEALTQEQARNVAEAQLNAVGLAVSDLPVVTVQREIVPFNRFWETGDVIHPSLQTRVVWNFHYGVPLDTIEIWVDAETGDVVGGNYEGTLGNGVKILNPKFGHQIKYKELAVKGK